MIYGISGGSDLTQFINFVVETAFPILLGIVGGGFLMRDGWQRYNQAASSYQAEWQGVGRIRQMGVLEVVSGVVLFGFGIAQLFLALLVS